MNWLSVNFQVLDHFPCLATEGHHNRDRTSMAHSLRALPWQRNQEWRGNHQGETPLPEAAPSFRVKRGRRDRGERLRSAPTQRPAPYARLSS